ncbi:substrate-binding periplasmic protein [Thalassotalea sediminis]|uniref:substrate-binding periplasmic protein n=1 Tax=Thalassotalea sediminis TaxID=1759089 RepID=UPI002573F2AF|nr:ABC transporter substrate-binding protein [Thalassotalea sediminis]
MNVAFKILLGSFILLWSSRLVISAQIPIFKIAAIDWCPQICPREEPNGYVVDIVLDIYKDFPIKVQIDYFPWSRAIKYVNDGTYDALLSPAKPEAPNLVYPMLAIGSQQMCFFSLTDNLWKYTGEKSLNNLRIGIAKDTSIKELNNFLQTNAHQFQFQPYLDRYVDQNYRKLLKGRIDTFLFTKNTTKWELRKLKVDHELRVSGCLRREPIYLGFTPTKQKKELIEKLSKKFDVGMHQLLASGQLETILEEYQLKQFDLFDMSTTTDND